MLEVLPVPAFRDNYIWLIVNPANHAAAIIDPGDAQPVLEVLQARNLHAVAILATHHHGDHVGGVQRIVERHPVPVYGPALENVPGMTHPVSGGARVELPGLQTEFEVIDVPGHTLGHIAFHGAGMVFVGDTLFMAGCGRLFEGTAAQLHASLERLSALPDATLAYCGHEYTEANLRFAAAVEPGNRHIRDRAAQAAARRRQGLPTVPAPIAEERRTNPFLRVHLPLVMEAASRQCGKPLRDPVEVFAAVRNWKDGF